MKDKGKKKDKCLVTFDEFTNAFTKNGYKAPKKKQYKMFCKSAGPKGAIEDKQEAAMALTHLLHESEGLTLRSETRCKETGCPGEYEDPLCDANGQRYFGRGFIQLSWCQNYKACSQDLFGDDRLVKNPEIVAKKKQISWDSAFWYWKTNVRNHPGVQDGFFGSSTNAINGKLECLGEFQNIARLRFQKYQNVREAFGLDPNEAKEGGCYS